jgi:hypothetical protein
MRLEFGWIQSDTIFSKGPGPMRRVLTVLLIGLTGCGGVHFAFRSNLPAGGPTFAVSGFVTVIQFSAVIDHGSFIDVTLVTFDQTGGIPSTVTFCGHMTNQFVMNAFTTADFTNGPACATLVGIDSGTGMNMMRG